MADQNRFSGLKELTVWKRQTDNYTITTQCGKCYSMGDHVAPREPPRRAALVCVTQCLALSRGATTSLSRDCKGKLSLGVRQSFLVGEAIIKSRRRKREDSQMKGVQWGGTKGAWFPRLQQHVPHTREGLEQVPGLQCCA